jgi:2-polyprenyl-6-methoxyphenol hydroxylase-like FAD-dependent oxidoreductase
LVVGAGPTGLVMACELLRHGVKVRVVDKARVASDKSRALVVHARTLEVLQRMGVASRFMEEGLPTLSIRLVIDGKPRARLDIKDIGADDTPFPVLLMLAQDRTEALLTARLTELGGSIERGVELTGLTQDADGCAAAFADGSSARYAYVVGCDGAHSVVRKSQGIPFEGAPYPEEFLLADARLDGWPYGYDALVICLTSGGLLAHFPLKGRELSRLIMTRGRELGRESELVTPAECQKAAVELARNPVQLSGVRWATNFRLHHRGVTRYREGRAFVAGDAAHIHSPAGGQGMNTGIQDAFNLAWKLALVARGKAPAALLATYDEERRPIGQKLLKVTDRFFQVMATPNRSLLFLRKLVATPVATVIAHGPRKLKRRAFRFVSQLAIRYHENAFIGPGAGRRAPDARTKVGMLFQQMTGTTHHLLCFGAPPPAGLDAAVAQTIVLDADEREAFGRYEVPGPGFFVLVRPDGHVALRTRDVTELRKYLAQFH